MCGIAGWLGHGPDSEVASRMLALMRHRGPDDTGAHSTRHATLLCARLRVMDPRPEAAQPFRNSRGTIASVCNGELYNAPELADRLAARGHVLRTTCDVEVLPALYEEHGPDFPVQLKGMFAVAVLDSEQRRLMLVRDRWGVKPLYYAVVRTDQGEALVFASELDTLFGYGVPRRPDPQAVADYAALGFVPNPLTAFRDVYALRPGEILDARLDDGRITCRRGQYHRWRVAPDPSLTLERAVRTTQELLAASVRRQSRSDVPLGVLVSGGIDSSLIAALYRRQDPDGPTFSMRFEDSAYDESWAARLVAEHLGLPNTVFSLPGMAAGAEDIVKVLRAMGQPYSDTSLFAMRGLSARVSESVTVCLAGDGGDEAFGGYERFSALAAALPGSTRDATGLVESMHRLLPTDVHRDLCVQEDVLPVRRLFEPQWEYDLDAGASLAERLVAHATEVSTRLVLADDYLVKGDMATMAFGLELRVPFLDEDLFEFALTLPAALKASPEGMKIVPRALAASLLPERVAKKPKWGFSIPPYEWLTERTRRDVADLLLGSDGLTGYFRAETYTPWIDAFREGRPLEGVHELDVFDRVIMLLSLAAHLDDPGTLRQGAVTVPMSLDSGG